MKKAFIRQINEGDSWANTVIGYHFYRKPKTITYPTLKWNVYITRTFMMPVGFGIQINLFKCEMQFKLFTCLR